MGREIRMVPPNWQHPKDDRGRYIGMRDRHFDDALKEWEAEFARAKSGDHEYYDSFEQWAEENRSPTPSGYRPWRNEEATWFQVWETVSEGTPVSPSFATREELIDYLANNGDFWDQRRGTPPPSRAQAEAFVNSGWPHRSSDSVAPVAW